VAFITARSNYFDTYRYTALSLPGTFGSREALAADEAISHTLTPAWIRLANPCQPNTGTSISYAAFLREVLEFARSGAIFGSEKCAILFLKIKLRAILYDGLLTRTRHAHRLEETSPPGSVPARRGTCAPSSSDASDRGAAAVDQGAT
jgi:hypothetical protein